MTSKKETKLVRSILIPLFLIIGLLGIVFASGFHPASQILSGTFSAGAFTFLGNLSVNNTVESVNGGFKFPDGSTQNVASVIPNVVSKEYTDVFSTASITFVNVTDFNISITPSSASSKILVMSNVVAGMVGATTGYYRVIRDSTPIAVPPDVAGYIEGSSASFYGGSTDGNNNEEATVIFLDSPGTTNEVTYRIQVASPTGIMRINSLGNDHSDKVYSVRARSSLTLMEVTS